MQLERDVLRRISSGTRYSMRTKLVLKTSLKFQSAMEYLMTYGWAILIVAIVIVALFQLGIFNNSNLTPHALPGACRVVRTIAGSSLAGQCNNEIPQYVAQFNGASSYLDLSGAKISLSGAFTISAWIRFNSDTSWMLIDDGMAGNPDAYYIYGDHVVSGGGNGPDCTVFSNTASRSDNFFSQLSTGRWYFLTCTLDPSSGHSNTYLNSIVANSISASMGAINSGVTIGKYEGGGYYLNGEVANLQVYNTSLSSNQISALYSEGIGGAPIDPTHIVGWWPLNGNANDYSGDNNNGVPNNISYNGSWTSGYTIP